MLIGRPSSVGALIGFLMALGVVATAPLFQSPAPIAGPGLSEHGGSIHRLVMQYTAGSQFVWPTYRQFLQYQPSSVVVYMVCPGPRDWSEIGEQLACERLSGERLAGVRLSGVRLSGVRCRIVPIFAGHAMTTWARDRWIALQPGTSGAVCLLSPKGELQQEVWAARAGDSQIASDIARALAPAVRTVRSSLYFDGGDILMDENFAFVTAAVFRRNLQHTVATRDQLIQRLEQDLHRQVIPLDDAPDHHAGMYMMPAGDHRMLIGDPSLGRPLLNLDDPDLAEMEGGPDLGSETQGHFNAVAKLAAACGYHVLRIPTIPGSNGKQFLTYVNVIMDEQSGRPIVYMPIYQHQLKLNAAAKMVWESLGYEVRPIDCSSLWAHGGTLHCLVNVLDRREKVDCRLPDDRER